MTAGDIIASSLRLLGVLASGEAPSANESNDALNSLNDMLDSWSLESLMIPNRVREVFPITSSQQTYTMGPGGDFSTTRPTNVENVLIQIVANSPYLELPLKLLTKDQYAGLLLKTITSPYPLYCYVEGTAPLETINLWPFPSQSDNLVIYSAKQLSDLTNLTTALSLPPGYERAIRYCLAIELAAEYGKEAGEQVIGIAVEAKTAIKRINWKPKFLQVDEAIISRPAVFNWYTGEPQ